MYSSNIFAQKVFHVIILLYSVIINCLVWKKFFIAPSMKWTKEWSTLQGPCEAKFRHENSNNNREQQREKEWVLCEETEHNNINNLHNSGNRKTISNNRIHGKSFCNQIRSFFMDSHKNNIVRSNHKKEQFRNNNNYDCN